MNGNLACRAKKVFVSGRRQQMDSGHEDKVAGEPTTNCRTEGEKKNVPGVHTARKHLATADMLMLVSVETL